MECGFEISISAVNALKEDYDRVCVEVVKAESKLKSLEEIYKAKKDQIAALNLENRHLQEMCSNYFKQCQSVEATIHHYRGVKGSLIANAKQKEEHFLKLQKKYDELIKAGQKENEDLQNLFDQVINDAWSDIPDFAKLTRMAREKARLLSEMEDLQKEDEKRKAERDAKKQKAEELAKRKEHIQFLQRERERYQQRVDQKEAECAKLEAYLSELEAEAQARGQAEKERNNVLEAEAAQQREMEEAPLASPRPMEMNHNYDAGKGDENDSINDSGMMTMIQSPDSDKVDEEEQGTSSGTNAAPDVLNKTTESLIQDGRCQSTPFVRSSLKGLVDTQKLNSLMLDSRRQPMESPIRQRPLNTNNTQPSTPRALNTNSVNSAQVTNTPRHDEFAKPSLDVLRNPKRLLVSNDNLNNSYLSPRYPKKSPVKESPVKPMTPKSVFDAPSTPKFSPSTEKNTQDIVSKSQESAQLASTASGDRNQIQSLMGSKQFSFTGGFESNPEGQSNTNPSTSSSGFGDIEPSIESKTFSFGEPNSKSEAKFDNFGRRPATSRERNSAASFGSKPFSFGEPNSGISGAGSMQGGFNFFGGGGMSMFDSGNVEKSVVTNQEENQGFQSFDFSGFGSGAPASANDTTSSGFGFTFG